MPKDQQIKILKILIEQIKTDKLEIISVTSIPFEVERFIGEKYYKQNIVIETKEMFSIGDKNE